MRTHEEINKEYSFHIGQLGYKTVTHKLLEEEIVEHHEKACELRREAAKLPPPTEVPAEEPKTA